VVAASGGAYDAYFGRGGAGSEMVRAATENTPYTRPGATGAPVIFGGNINAIPQSHRQALISARNDPRARQTFDARYGRGAAAAVLGRSDSDSARMTGP
jgi:hypothetical protein